MVASPSVSSTSAGVYLTNVMDGFCLDVMVTLLGPCLISQTSPAPIIRMTRGAARCLGQANSSQPNWQVDTYPCQNAENERFTYDPTTGYVRSVSVGPQAPWFPDFWVVPLNGLRVLDLCSRPSV
jgi:hypothetical protein